MPVNNDALKMKKFLLFLIFPDKDKPNKVAISSTTLVIKYEKETSRIENDENEYLCLSVESSPHKKLSKPNVHPDMSIVTIAHFSAKPKRLLSIFSS